jgi:hypothetical protein
MQRLEVSGAVRHIYMSLSVKGLNINSLCTSPRTQTVCTTETSRLTLFREIIDVSCGINSSLKHTVRQDAEFL